MIEVQVNKLPLAHVRAQLGLSQESLAEMAGVSYMTISNIERRATKKTALRTAYAILKGLNMERTQQGLDNLQLSDIDWTIQGE